MIKETLKNARLKKELSQRQLASLLGVKFQQVQQWEYGTRTPNIENLYKLSKALELSIEDLAAEYAAEKNKSH